MSVAPGRWGARFDRGNVLETDVPARMDRLPLLGAGLMILGGLTEVFLGVDAEGRRREDVAAPLTGSQ